LLLVWSASDHSLVAQQANAQPFERVAGRDTAPRRVLVKFRASAGAEAVRDAEQQADADVSVPVGRTGRVRLIHSRTRSAAALAAILRSHPEIEYVEPDYVVRAVAIPNDIAFQVQWGLRNTGLIINGLQGVPGADVDAEAAWNIARGSANVVIGVIDGGFDYKHPDLAANVWSAPRSFTVTIGPYTITCPAGTHGARFEFATATCDPSPIPAPHATNVAGIAGAVGGNEQGVAGMSWRTSLISLNFLLDGQTGYVSDAINAVDFAIQVKSIFAGSAAGNLRVLNNSWIGAGYSQVLQDAIDRAGANDILWVGAAGNSAVNLDSSPDYPASFNRPNQLTLAASNNRDERAGFSNYSPTKVHMAAPGQDIYSTLPNGTYGYYSGTSMASPMAAGAAALVLSRCEMNTADLKSLLMSSVDQVPAFASITVSGGRLNVARALQTCASGRPGVPPGVWLTAPLDRTVYSQPATIRLNATADDTDGSVVRVDFYAGSTLIGSSADAPYSTTWSGVPAGSYALKAVAIDNEGMQTASDSVSVTVESAGGGATDIVFHARDIPPSALHGAWSTASDTTAADGTKLVTSDSGFATTETALASPTHYIDVTFNAPAGVPYAIWLRLNALNDNKFNDSVWVQFSDANANGSAVYPINSSSGLCVNLATDATASSLDAWGWQNGCYWLSQPTRVTFTSSGTHTMRIQVREDGVQLDQIVLSPATYLTSAPGPAGGDHTSVPKPGGPPPPPPPPPSEIVVYASDLPASARHGTWTTAADAASPFSTKLVTSNNGVSNANAPLAAPADYIDVGFSADAGIPYTIWFRLKALNNDKFNDAIWAQFSDAMVSGSPVYPLNSTSGLMVNLATDATASSLNNWGWVHSAYWLNQATTVTFATSGVHTLRIQVREDGVQLDQIVLSPGRYKSSPPGPPTNDSTIVAKPAGGGQLFTGSP
jgi:subtilisin family serine protease